MNRFALLLVLSPRLLCADSLTDLKTALQGLKGQAPIKGTVEVSTWRKSGEGKEATETAGQASAWVEDGAQGMKMQWSRSLLQQIEQEAQARKINSKAKTPATAGMGAMAPRTVSGMVHQAPELLRQLETATLTAETRETWNGRQVRALTFTVPLTGIGEKERKMVKDYKGTAKILLDDDGTPLALTRKTYTAGRAYVVITFNSDEEVTQTFAKVGDRLVCTRFESKNNQGGSETSQSVSTRSFKVQ